VHRRSGVELRRRDLFVIVVDGHLDIAFNEQCYGRDPRLSAHEIRRREGDRWKERFRGKCMVGIPELEAGRVAIVFATIFVPRARDVEAFRFDPDLAYTTAGEAEARGLQQLDFYRALAEEGDGVRLLGSRDDLEGLCSGWESGATGAVGFVPLLEGADPIRRPEDVSMWFEKGVRIVGLSWRSTRYAGGTGEPGPLTAAGRELLGALHEAGIVLDLSHASEESFHEEVDLYDGPIIASHSNPRAVCDGDRQLTDDMIQKIAGRGGVIGMVPYNRMLDADWQPGAPPVPLSRVAESIQHVSQVTGTHETAAIGSDFDGGFGADSAPSGIDTVADLPRIGDALADLDFTDDMIYDILGRNWIRFLERSWPG
jgi:membrane dipeptidase